MQECRAATSVHSWWHLRSFSVSSSKLAHDKGHGHMSAFHGCGASVQSGVLCGYGCCVCGVRTQLSVRRHFLLVVRTLLSCLTILVGRNLRWRRREKLVSAIRTSFHLISALEVRMDLTECLGGDRQAEQAVAVA